MKSIVFNLLLAFSITTVSAEPISTSPLVDLLNMLQQSFTGSNDDNNFGIESKKKVKQTKMDGPQKREKPEQVSRTGWIKTPQGLKFYIRAGNNEITDNVSDNEDGLIADNGQEAFIENENVQNCEPNNNEENNEEHLEKEKQKAVLLANQECSGVPCSIEEPNGPAPEFREECEFRKLQRGPGSHYAREDRRDFERRRWRKPHRDRWECGFCCENLEEAMYVEMRRQTSILRHIERMLMDKKGDHFNHKRNKSGRF